MVFPKFKPLHRVLLSVLLFCLFYYSPLQAEPGITENAIILGQSCALSGPAEDLGKSMKAGIIAALEQSNTEKTIQNKKVILISKDDYYEPGQAIKNTKALIEQKNVFLLIGEVGTPTSKAAAPIAQKAGVPFLAPYTGARFLRHPVKKTIINIRAGYDEETRKIAEYLVETKKFSKIACFYQNDSYGKAGLDGIKNALADYGIKLIAQDTYERNTVAVMGGVLRIRKASPEAVLIVGSYQPCAEFIKLARVNGMTDTVFCSLSFAGSESLKNALRKIEKNIIISQVFPSFHNSDLPIANEYLQAMKNFQPDHKPGYISFEGYIAGRFFIHVAQSLNKKLTRRNFIEYIENKKKFNIGGIQMNFSQDDHQGLDAIYLTRILNGKIVGLD